MYQPLANQNCPKGPRPHHPRVLPTTGSPPRSGTKNCPLPPTAPIHIHSAHSLPAVQSRKPCERFRTGCMICRRVWMHCRTRGRWDHHRGSKTRSLLCASKLRGWKCSATPYGALLAILPQSTSVGRDIEPLVKTMVNHKSRRLNRYNIL